MHVKRNPAVLAGLMGTAGLLAPQTAHALSLAEAADAVGGMLANPQVAFAAGALSGALVVGATCGIVAAARSRARRHEQEIVEGFAQVEKTGAFDGGIDLDAQDSPEPAARPRHMRAATPRPTRAPEPATAAEPSTASASPAGSHATDDYAQIAQNYVNQITFRQRMARRAEGVAAALASRFGADMMDGLPVIERADGSVGDVGTSWWKTEVGQARISSNNGFAVDEVADISIPSSFSAEATQRAVAAVAEQQRSSRADIASRLAFIDEGVFPERRTMAEAASDDWEQALRSMDENIAADPETPNQDPIEFIDATGGADTLDEPDNMEPNTSFIPFRTPAGHPEVVDTESYVDYLIEDEFGRNSSKAARRTSRRYLRILEGGTSATGTGMRHASGAAPVRGGKHFSRPVAAEA